MMTNEVFLAGVILGALVGGSISLALDFAKRFRKETR